MDDGDANYSELVIDDKWKDNKDKDAYGGMSRKNKKNGGDSAIWTFHGLPICAYEVLVTYPKHKEKNAPYHVYDDVSELRVVEVNQDNDPSGPLYDGSLWDSLGGYVIRSGTLCVELSDDATKHDVVADAVRIVPIEDRVEILNVDASPDKGTLDVEVSVTVP